MARLASILSRNGFLVLILSFLFSCPALAVIKKPAAAGANAKATSSAAVTLKASPVQDEATGYIAQYLMQNHYRKVAVNDSLSREIFNRYLEHLDAGKSYFIASEVESMRQYYGTRFDNEFLTGKSTSGFAVYNFFLKRAREKMRFMKAVADTAQFDFSRPETLNLDRKSDTWPLDRNELYAIWRKELKYQWLNLKYGAEKESSIRTALSKRYANRLKLLNLQKSDDAFQAYMFAVTTSFDPHTNYFSPDEFENFQIDLSRSLEGIGAKLQMESDFTVVNEIIPGGPAFKSSLLKKSDRIIGVGQGRTSEIVDVTGWRLNDVVKKIRGPKGTYVRLKILPASQAGRGPAKIVQLVRDKINLDEQAAQKRIMTLNNEKIGVITIPSFYLDFEAQKRHAGRYNSTSRDVARIIGELKAQKVQGIIIDLRDNGGGSLEEAVNVTGLFISNGPVVQVSNSSGGKMVLRDEDNRVLFDGPIAVLVNRYSASASEIFAAAIQDYGRGVIIGERTFGKGTVQSIVKLTRPFSFFANKAELGQMKLTIAKFYRISGESTQHKGVVPDIGISSLIDTSSVGEDTYTSSLPWSTISKALYTPLGTTGKISTGRLLQQYKARSSSQKVYQDYMRDLASLNAIRKKKVVSLNEKTFKTESERLKQIEQSWAVEQDGVKNPSKDFMLNRSAEIMSDMIPPDSGSQALK
ncbi:carboxy terminal-processing peptidase [Chlorobium phaeobacteroides]|uniref:C-terminal processing peptidase-1, Serine peptidase, MEROPS family S41A n=1 Tax=Chlorobium phaeobacteroides (strain DSM 266 / SMG 266 / 2430) TaxID=290317 RepID=A1BG32_CHLPD|nr:carboxy terminal-processing peptidase [Chlorobium phaeobacteroides]ABL65359.1 C-terminal processing peptidase-1, Serine peptidase, MEROPS family S41A [Chlorobium phaeobacteroides DSM 266]